MPSVIKTHMMPIWLSDISLLYWLRSGDNAHIHSVYIIISHGFSDNMSPSNSFLQAIICHHLTQICHQQNESCTFNSHLLWANQNTMKTTVATAWMKCKDTSVSVHRNWMHCEQLTHWVAAAHSKVRSPHHACLLHGEWWTLKNRRGIIWHMQHHHWETVWTLGCSRMEGRSVRDGENRGEWLSIISITAYYSQLITVKHLLCAP